MYKYNNYTRNLAGRSVGRCRITMIKVKGVKMGGNVARMNGKTEKPTI
jgi:pimeloyl-CoA synthetase